MNKRASAMKMTSEKYESLLKSVKLSNLLDEEKLEASNCIEFAAHYGQKLTDQQATIDRLKKALFGGSEKSSANTSSSNSSSENQNEKDKSFEKANNSNHNNDNEGKEEKQKRRGGNGRTSERAYNAEDVYLNHDQYSVGDDCPMMCGGKLYRVKNTGKFIRIVGQPLAKAIRYHQEVLRCALCGEVYKAKIPDYVSTSKYDERFIALLIMNKYYLAVPFYRQSSMQSFLNVPLASSTQWELLKQHEDVLLKIFDYLKSIAAQASLFIYDDTTMPIQAQTIINKKTGSKKGTYTTGVLAYVHERIIPLFICAPKTAGINISELWDKRETKLLAPPILMCDGLSANRPENIPHDQYIYANCLTHARRKFIELQKHYPKVCNPIIDMFSQVYRNDKHTKEMTDYDRLAYHQEHTTPVMNRIRGTLTQLIDDKRYEPNSQIMKAVNYSLKRWYELTVFLREAGAPLDSNSAEQILKIPIRQRKNSQYFKTIGSAYLSTAIISIVMSCVFSEIDPVEYLTALFKNKGKVLLNPSGWLPWEYKNTHETSCQELVS